MKDYVERAISITIKTIMNEEQKQVLLEYEELKLQEKQIKSRLDELKPVVLEVVPEETKVNVTDGYFERKKRDNWTFGPDIQTHEQSLKDEKAAAIAKGEATNNPTFYIEYRQNKRVAVDNSDEAID